MWLHAPNRHFPSPTHVLACHLEFLNYWDFNKLERRPRLRTSIIFKKIVTRYFSLTNNRNCIGSRAYSLDARLCNCTPLQCHYKKGRGITHNCYPPYLTRVPSYTNIVRLCMQGTAKNLTKCNKGQEVVGS